MKIIILTGMSGSGKATAFKMLEDMGYNCVDNLPVPLLKSFIDLSDKPGQLESKVAVGIDIRNGDNITHLTDILEELDQDNKKYDILFMDAEDEVLIQRYKETRRNHPLSGDDSIQVGIKKEREALKFIKEKATYIIDTSHLLTRELKIELEKIFVKEEDFKSMFVTIMSFGFKYGIPSDADMVLDVRFLPNPYYDPALRPMTGNDSPIKHFVMDCDEAKVFMEKSVGLIQFLIPKYISEGKNQLVIAVGCTGGKHRSVCIANALYQALNDAQGYGIKIEHRDITKDALRGK